MPKTVTRYDVLISCPSDVGEYIENIKRSIHRFNSTYGDYRDVIKKIIKPSKRIYAATIISQKILSL